jgi:serine/threonine protein kinase/tetratricopeptide (TPR) repeat protein
MKPERWQEIERLYHAALDREESQRAAYLREACAEDAALRREVESLLAQESRAERLLETPALEVAARVLAEHPCPSSLVGKVLGLYKIVSMLGAGGMGEVYQAHDSKLGRDVAIKVLPQPFVDEPERLARFQREARMLASLNHPNIATIHGLEQSEGVHYLVMELVPGQTLAERVCSGALKIEEALKVAAQIAEALEAAHEKGVIHRDLKPANVKVTPEGRVKVLDFGLAKVFANDGGLDLSNAPTLTAMGTEDGRILGTPAYMSPEQARGRPVDKRTDIWAFGCVLYELLTRKEAFRGETVSDTIAAVLEREPDWQTLPPSTPAKIRDLLRRCLQKDSQRRPRDFRDLRIQLEEAPTTATSRPWWLRRTAVGIAAVALIVLLVAAGWSYRFAPRGETIDSVAVLPFVNASADPDTEYLSDGITESLINSLSQLPHLKVMSRDAGFRYKGKETDAQTVGRDLGVQAVFKGRVAQRGDSLAISAELIDARDNSHIWGQQYSRKPSDIFGLQDEIAREMTTALRLRLTAEEQKRLVRSYTSNPEAYQDYLRGRYFWQKTGPGLNKGIEYFQQAIAKDPRYALAYDGLADSYISLAVFGFSSPKEAYPRAKEAALKSLEIDGTLAEAHTSLARIKAEYDWDWSGAEREFQRAIELNPSYAATYQSYGSVLSTMGRPEEAIANYKRALELDPLSPAINGALGVALYFTRQYDQAIEQLRKTLELDPNLFFARAYLAYAYLQKSMNKEAIAELEKHMVISHGFVWAVAEFGYAYAVLGRKPEAQRMLDRLNQLSKQEFVPADAMAKIYIGFGDKGKAFEWLEKGYERHSLGLGGVDLKVDPVWDPLRSDPRFADLLRRTNLQP